MNLTQLLGTELKSSPVSYKPVKIGYKTVPIYHIPVKVLPNTEDWKFVWAKYRWHYHDKQLCTDDKCQTIVMAVF